MRTRPPAFSENLGLKKSEIASERCLSMTDYKAALNQRFWEYRRAKFPGASGYFDRQQADDRRPPVLLPREAWRNVIERPDAGQQEIERLRALIPETDRHKWFRS